ncbi:MAG TPA: UDP-N-acetylmuramate--L-alanine ligase, partial [Clostridiales bacterium]|nr:UDP-N-acetylmuramate--L-alanine ligase [Clostridiales bacterium]
CNIVTFGLDKGAYYARNIKLVPEPSYTLMHGDEEIAEIKLKVYGEHNILNSLAAAAASLTLGIEPETV